VLDVVSEGDTVLDRLPDALRDSETLELSETLPLGESDSDRLADDVSEGEFVIVGDSVCVSE
jgi:hypothetical protein